MKEKAARGFEKPEGLLEAWFEKTEVIREKIAEGFLADADRAVALGLESRSVAVVVADGFDLRPGLGFPRIERRINIDEVEGLILELLEDFKIIPEIDFDHAGSPSQRICKKKEFALTNRY